jgi:hypothetical protein
MNDLAILEDKNILIPDDEPDVLKTLQELPEWKLKFPILSPKSLHTWLSGL